MFSLRGDENHPWASAKEEFEDKILPILTKEGLKIGEACGNGDVNAANIIRYYTMLRRSFDPVTLELIKGAMRSYGVLK